VTRMPHRRSGPDRVWTNPHALGAKQTQTRVSPADILSAEGGGFIPTLFLGGGAGFSRIRGLAMVACERRCALAAPARQGGLA
jgi:hypothetical protein